MTDDTHLDAGTVAAYLDRGLSAAQKTVVEAHLAECAACRAEVVQLGGLLHPRRVRQRTFVVGTAIAAAATLLFLVLPKSVDAPGTGDPDITGASALRIRALGAVTQPPIYLGVSVRAPSARGEELFMSGMRAYNEARYADAVAALRDARTAGLGGASTPFLLGASLLMLDDATGAAAEFAHVIDLGPTQYRAEAHYYRAKALLRMNRASEAAAALDQSVRDATEPIKSIAGSLLDSVRIARAR
jgi:hypothetical protein